MSASSAQEGAPPGGTNAAVAVAPALPAATAATAAAAAAAPEPFVGGAGTKEETHHVSDVDAWGTADRHMWLYALLAIFPLSGFLGADHLYLRSYKTAMTKALFNIVSLGFWYFWDAAQMLSPPDRERAQSEGLRAPFEWIRGIGRGVFGKGWSASGPSPPKSYLLYTLLSIPLLGVFGLNKLYIGQPGAFVVKILTLILFPIAIIWAFLDFGRLLFFTESVLQDGIPGAPKWWPLDSLVPPTGCDVFTLADESRCKTRTLPENPDTEGKGFLYKILYWIGATFIEPVIPSQSGILRKAGGVAIGLADAMNTAPRA